MQRRDDSAVVRVESIIPGVQAGEPVQVSASPAAPPIAPEQASGPPAVAPQSPGVYLQLGAFASQDNAESFLRRMRAELPLLDGLAAVVPGEKLYRVQAGPYADRAQAQQMAQRIERILDLKPLLVTR